MRRLCLVELRAGEAKKSLLCWESWHVVVSGNCVGMGSYRQCTLRSHSISKISASHPLYVQASFSDDELSLLPTQVLSNP